MIEATAIRYFREVIQCGSIKRAADVLQIAPSAISRQIQGLEHELAVKLFERGARGMTLTDAGHLLHRYSLESRKQIDTIRMQVQEHGSLQRGHVRIATVEGMMASLVAGFVVAFSEEQPGVTVNVTTVGSRSVADMVAKHEVDLGLVFGRSPRRDLIELGHMRQSLCLMVAPNHPLAGMESCTIGELKGIKVVLPDQSFGIRQEIDRICAQARIELDLYSETNSLAYAREIVSQTKMATFLPRDAARGDLARGSLVAVPLRHKQLEAMQVTLVQPATKSLTPAAKRVAEMLIKRMKIRDVPVGRSTVRRPRKSV